MAENVDALEVRLVKSKKVLKEASKMQSKLLTRVAKQKMAMEKGHPTEAAHQEATWVLRQMTEQFDRVKSTIAHHTADIAHIEALLKDYESTDEESSSLAEGSPLRSGSRDPTTIMMRNMTLRNRDLEDIPNPPQGTATQTDSPPEATEDDSKSEKDVIAEEERIITEGGGITPITPADDRLLDQDDQQDQIRTETPSGTVTESFSQMNMDSPASTLVVSDPPGGDQEA